MRVRMWATDSAQDDKCSISNKNTLFPTPSPKITSGEILVREAAEERIWAGRTPPAGAPGPGRSEECARYHMKNSCA